MDPATITLLVNTGISLTTAIAKSVPWDKLDEKSRQKMIDKKIDRMNLDKRTSILISYAVHLATEIQNSDYTTSFDKESVKAYKKLVQSINTYVGVLAKSKSDSNKLIDLAKKVRECIAQCALRNALMPTNIPKIQNAAEGLIILSSVDDMEAIQEMDKLIDQYGLEAKLSQVSVKKSDAKSEKIEVTTPIETARKVGNTASAVLQSPITESILGLAGQVASGSSDPKMQAVAKAACVGSGVLGSIKGNNQPTMEQINNNNQLAIGQTDGIEVLDF